jgi:hypothetical protein
VSKGSLFDLSSPGSRFPSVQVQAEMARTLSFMIIAVLALAGIGVSQTPEKGPEAREKVPTSSAVEVTLVHAPGINDEGSLWEINYEFRIASDASVWDAHKRKDGSEALVGDLLKEGSCKQTLRSTTNRRVILTVPLAAEMQERLRSQPSPGEAAKTNLTAEESRKLEERSQSFRFRLVAEVYDAKLRKSVLISQAFLWPFAGYPEARFEIKIQINAEGGYRIDASRPKGGGGKEIIRDE